MMFGDMIGAKAGAVVLLDSLSRVSNRSASGVPLSST